MNALEMRISARALRDAAQEIRRDIQRKAEGSYPTKGASTALQIADWLTLKADRLDREAGQ